MTFSHTDTLTALLAWWATSRPLGKYSVTGQLYAEMVKAHDLFGGVTFADIICIREFIKEWVWVLKLSLIHI